MFTALENLITNEEVGESTVQSVEASVEKASTLFTNIAEKIKDSMPSMLFAIVIFIIGLIISKIILRIVGKILNKSNVDNTATSFLVSLIRIVLYIFVIVIVLTLLNVPMTSIIAVIGAAGLAVGLALQNSLSNIAGGFIILFSKPFKSGDLVEIDGSQGTVEAISILYTKIVTGDNKTILIPNGKVSETKIVNFTESPTRRVDLTFDISYNNDYEKAKAILYRVIGEQTQIIKDKDVLVRIGEHRESSIAIYVRVWVENANYWPVYFDLLEKVKFEFDKNNIEIPYNQLDIHIKEK